MRKVKKRIKVLLLCSLMVALVSFFSACGNGEPATPATPAGNEPVAQEPKEMLELTLKELAEFDGKEDRSAYVAVDGVIYDVTDSSRWRGGVHNSHEAGQDLTEEIKNISPHGIRVLERMPIVGKLVE